MQSPRRLSMTPLILAALAATVHADDRPESTATKPAPREANWVKRHEGFVAMARRGGIDLLFLGDSITDGWGGEGHNRRISPGADLFDKEFKPLKSANFGIGGDRTQHVLWRLQNGELDGIQPKVLMLMIGTNNSNINSKTKVQDNTAEEIAAGVKAIVNEIRQRSPQTKILLLGIFPRGEDPRKTESVKVQREKLKKVNAIIANLDDGGKSVKYLDIGDKFLEPDGTLSKEIMPDFLHLSPKGYQIWADAVKGPIQELLGKS